MSQRNHLIDLARALSVFVVVTFHCLLYRIVLVDGRPQIVPWAPLPHASWWTASWFVMIVPLFFIAGGYAHTLVIDRANARGDAYPYYLAARAHRLVGPLIVFVGFATALSTAGAWLFSAPFSIELSVQFAQLLWFVATYLVIVAVAPFMVRAQDRWGAWPMVGLAVAAAAIDAWSFTVGDSDLRYLNLLTVWPLCHQFGIAYYRGWFRSWRPWAGWTIIAAVAATIAVLIFGFGYPASSIGLGDIPIANVLPPTLAMAVLALGQTAALGLMQRAGVAATLSPRAEHGLAVANALAVTTYLWHIPCIVIAGAALVGLSLVFPAATGVLLAQATVAVVTWCVIGLVIPQIGRLEYRLIPASTSPRRGAVIAAFVVMMAGTALIWRFGTVVHPDQPVSAVGLLLLGCGMAWLARRASRPARIS